jgi:hypothetical protein
MIKKIIFLFFAIHITIASFAQKEGKDNRDPFKSTELWEAIPINRQLSHDKIDKLQKSADQFDGNIDGEIDFFGKKIETKLLTETLLKKVDKLQIIVENNPLDHWKKVKYLMHLETDLKQYYTDMMAGTIVPSYYKDLIENFEIILRRQIDGEDVLPHVKSNFSRSLYGSMHMFKEELPAIEEVYNGMVKTYPVEMMKKFNEFARYEAAQTMMTYLAPRKPNLILTYATSTSAERSAVRKCQDPLVQKIVEIADKAKTPLRAITFLDQMNNGSMTFSDVNAITQDNTTYYKSLVQLRLKENQLSKKVIDRECKLMALEYVRVMNELHDSPDATRFKGIETLSPQEIYFLMVLCSDEIYTSTFVGSFNRMLLKMSPTKGDLFLRDLNLDKFRTFIRMCAGYNKLGEFLATIDEENRNDMMAKFVKNIDKNAETDLEDAVDVADAFGSIEDTKLLDYLLEEVRNEYERTYRDDNKRGMITYFLLHTLCNSIIYPNENNDALQAQLKVPPIHYMPDARLVNIDGKVIEQVFFYGDEDGKISFASFQSNFKPDEWKLEKNDKWITYTSIKGKSISVYANLPLEEPKDEEALKALSAHLKENKIEPSILVHRGHSYHLSTTLENVTANNKIIVLGSCGGYHNLSNILNNSEDAHIISSKQTGTMSVNDPILRAINTRVLAGQDINWIELWNEVEAMMKTPDLKDKFNDYVPPHKNMGALFLKAFKIQVKENGMM